MTDQFDASAGEYEERFGGVSGPEQHLVTVEGLAVRSRDHQFSFGPAELAEERSVEQGTRCIGHRPIIDQMRPLAIARGEKATLAAATDRRRRVRRSAS